MGFNQKLLARPFPVFFSTTLLALCFIALYLFIPWYHDYGDSIVYAWIAEQYHQGEFAKAVNTYWGPLLSWLLALLRFFSNDYFLLFRCLNALTALLILVELFRWVNYLCKSNNTQSLLFMLPLSLLLAYFSWFYYSPDLLLLYFSLTLMRLLFNASEINHFIFKLALTGAFMYFTKAAGLVIFSGTLCFFLLFLWWKKESKKTSKLLLAQVLVLIFIGPWIYIVSAKWGSFTIGTASSFNAKLQAPELTPDLYGELGNPYNFGKLTKPHPSNNYYAWVEPNMQVFKAWEGMSKKEIVTYHFKIMLKNAKSLRSIYLGVDVGTLLFALALLLFGLGQLKSLLKHRFISVMLLFFIVLNGIYFPVFYMKRYVWPGLLVLHAVFFYFLFNARLGSKKIVLIVASVLVVLVYMYYYFTEIKAIKGYPNAKEIYSEVNGFKTGFELNNTAVVCYDTDPFAQGWANYLCLYNKGTFYGAQFYNKKSREEITATLKQNNIKHILLFDNGFKTEDPTYKNVFQGKNFKIMEIIKKP